MGDGSYGTRGCRDDENELQETNQIQRVPVERRTQQLLRAKQCVQDFDNIKIHNNHDGTGYTSRRAHIRCTGGPLHLDSEQGAELRHRGNMETDMWIHSLGSTGALGRKFFCGNVMMTPTRLQSISHFRKERVSEIECTQSAKFRRKQSDTTVVICRLREKWENK